MKNQKECQQTRLMQGSFWCDNYADAYIGDCKKLHQKVSSVNHPQVQNFEAKVSCCNYIYFVCWSDDAGLNGFLAELIGSNTVFSGSHPKWEVLPAGIDHDRKGPSAALVEEQLQKAKCEQWKTVSVGQPNTKSGKPHGHKSGINTAAHFIWYDSGNDPRSKYPAAPYVPFAGFNHDEFLIFRFPVKELFKEQCYKCECACECNNDCACSPCEKVQEKQRDLLKDEALAKAFTIYGKGNNTRRCRAPYSNQTCSELDLPNIEPCFYIHWGDSRSDKLETHDDEIVYITACNPYKNLSFKGLIITNITITPASPILPNGEKVIQIVPDTYICLGDVQGCSCASQALTLLTRGAKAQNYYLHVEYCIDSIVINAQNTGKTLFNIHLINS